LPEDVSWVIFFFFFFLVLGFEPQGLTLDRYSSNLGFLQPRVMVLYTALALVSAGDHSVVSLKSLFLCTCFMVGNYGTMLAPSLLWFTPSPIFPQHICQGTVTFILSSWEQHSHSSLCLITHLLYSTGHCMDLHAGITVDLLFWVRFTNT
jgi:hypothetical protein